MRIYLLILVAVICCSCVRNNPYAYVNCCQKDYWDDYKTNIFARKNCVGDTGHWNSDVKATTGFYCLGPHCIAQDTITCKDTCSVPY